MARRPTSLVVEGGSLVDGEKTWEQIDDLLHGKRYTVGRESDFATPESFFLYLHGGSRVG